MSSYFAKACNCAAGLTAGGETLAKMPLKEFLGYFCKAMYRAKLVCVFNGLVGINPLVCPDGLWPALAMAGKQAKTISDAELRRLLRLVCPGRYAARDRGMGLLSIKAGPRGPAKPRPSHGLWLSAA